ncbi:helix-turn-helix domain-containing protein [Microbacterium sp. P04]|uniref:MmyB family transcriptional regulator n=1 Tax=Microbacterium sp. P04 TaxID=3366947 RepID=UPI003745722A
MCAGTTNTNTRIGAYLAARRSLISPDEVGLTTRAWRAARGLTREQLARASGVSKERMLAIERGDAATDAELEALAGVLQLDAHARAHLARLARDAPPLWPASPASARTHELLGAWSRRVAFVVDRNLDLLDATALARRVLGEFAEPGTNQLVTTFRRAAAATDDRDRWYAVARYFASALRYYGDPADPRYAAITSSLDSDMEFQRIWRRHDAGPLTQELPRPRLLIDGVGWLDFEYEVFEVPRAPGQAIIVLWFDSDSGDSLIIDRLADSLT